VTGVPGPVPCQCLFCISAGDSGWPVPAATAEDLLCDQCRSVFHKMMSALLAQPQDGPESSADGRA
jgi:hypothetical protein